MKKIIFAGLFLSLILTGCTIGGKKERTLKPEEAKQKAETFINDNFIKGDNKATVDLPVKEKGLYKFNVNLSGQKPVESYMTLDGSVIFPQGIATKAAETADDAGTAESETAVAETKTANLPKTDKPKVELFVMSYCPYGTQIEKGILPATEALGGKIDFKIKYVDYAMHGEKEVNENTVQYCIDKEQKNKYNSYLKCFLKAGNQAGCLKSEKIDQAKLNACTAATYKQFKITEGLNDKSKWKGSYPPFDINKAENEKYSVQGSPTLVINGKIAESERNSASLLKTICSAFKKQPAECSKKLSAADPAPGFGEGAGSGGSTAGCGQ